MQKNNNNKKKLKLVKTLSLYQKPSLRMYLCGVLRDEAVASAGGTASHTMGADTHTSS